MSFRVGENSDVTSENMEQEQKINIEETSINLGYVKKEFQENQYETASNFENISDESSEQRNSGDSFKEENLKQETIEQSLCIELEIIQCHCCKVLFEEREDLENHMLHCLDAKSNRLYDNKLDIQRKPSDEIEEAQGNDEMSTAIDDNRNPKDHLKTHLNTHNSKPFECDICTKRFIQNRYLKMHIMNIHSNINEKKYKCTECSFHTNYEGSLKRHLNNHNNIKPFECDICKKRFIQKLNLKKHIKNIHSNTNEKKYKCFECSFQTNYKFNLKTHLYTHSNIKAFDCDICKEKFAHKVSLKVHIEDKHSNTNEKKYKCTKCSYQTNQKGNLKLHLNRH